jgi:hypothetical protein
MKSVYIETLHVQQDIFPELNCYDGDRELYEYVLRAMEMIFVLQFHTIVPQVHYDELYVVVLRFHPETPQ